MITELESSDTTRIQPILPKPGIFLALESIAAGYTPARIFVDNPTRPGSALIWSRNYCFLAGATGTAEFNQSLKELFINVIFPERLASGAVTLELFSAASVQWVDASTPGITRSNRFDYQAQTILADKDPLPDRREYYQIASASITNPGPIPAGFQLVPVNQDLLAQKDLRYLDRLKEELVSERPTIEDFFAKSFGVALVNGNELAGWCLSEYNTGSRCEVGIETVEAYRRRGLGRLMGCALILEARRRKISQVGWHCFAWNTASAATALSIGYKKVADYPIYFTWYHRASNLAVHGNIFLRQALYSEALEWFERSTTQKDAPSWAYWGAGCACARLGDQRRAFQWLRQAIDRGFTDNAAFANSPHLEGLRQSPEWMILMKKLREK